MKLRLGLLIGSFCLAGAVAAEPMTMPSSSDRALGKRPAVSPETHSVARLWNEALLEAIRIDVPRVSVHARNLFHTSAAMYDAWAAYSEEDLAVLHHEAGTAPADMSLQEAREKALSFAAYRLLSHRFEISPGSEASQQAFDDLMLTLGYDTGDTGTDGNRPAAVGNRVANAIIEHGLDDGSNESATYVDPGGYNPVNAPMLVALPGTSGAQNLNAWQPLIPPQGTGAQAFLTPHWGNVVPFFLEHDGDDAFVPPVDPGPPPLLGGEDDQWLKENIIGIIDYSSRLDPANSEPIDISPGATGNNDLGTQNGTGHPLNPVTGQPYAEQVVSEGDWGRVLAEFWEDGPASSTPPGHWTEVANAVSDQLEEKRLMGTGPVIDDLEWDIKLYLALHGALHDSAIAAWRVKADYNSSRPITLVRGMAELGQSGDPDLPGYHEQGLPLEPGLIEVITEESSAPGERHAHLADHVGEVALLAWRGHPDDPESDYAGVGWIRALEWMPYQAINFITPPFAGYVSAHSVFSRSAAEVLAEITGSEFFPGGLAEYPITPDGDQRLRFESGPSEPITLQWATYFDASDESGLSRVYGGIHPAFDDFPGRIMGHTIGTGALTAAMAYFAPIEDGTPPTDADPLPVPVNAGWALLIFVLALFLAAGHRLRRT